MRPYDGGMTSRERPVLDGPRAGPRQEPHETAMPRAAAGRELMEDRATFDALKAQHGSVST